MLYFENILLWDDNHSPTRIPSITIDTVKLGASAAAEWIVVGPYRIKILVEGGKDGLKVSDTKGNVLADAPSGCIFIDHTMFEVQSRSGSALGGSFSGCIDVRWD